MKKNELIYIYRTFELDKNENLKEMFDEVASRSTKVFIHYTNMDTEDKSVLNWMNDNNFKLKESLSINWLQANKIVNYETVDNKSVFELDMGKKTKAHEEMFDCYFNNLESNNQYEFIFVKNDSLLLQTDFKNDKMNVSLQMKLAA